MEPVLMDRGREPDRIKEGVAGKIKERAPDRAKAGAPDRVKEGAPGRVKEGAPGRVKEGAPGRVKEGAPGRVKEGTRRDNTNNKKEVSVHRAPHLRRSRALEVRTVRLRARRLASTAPCKRLRCEGLEFLGRFNPVNK
jgi:hypothetical protein